MRTCAAGKAACVAALLDNGASQQVQTALNPTAVTPMLLAASFGHDECVRLLAAHNPAGAAPRMQQVCWVESCFSPECPLQRCMRAMQTVFRPS